jgi:hypothetical protein
MSSHRLPPFRRCLLLGLAFLAVPSLLECQAEETSREPSFKLKQFRGKVVLYGAALEEQLGIALEEPIASELYALVTDKGEILPLLPTGSALLFSADPRTRDRPMQITARVYEKTPGLHVIEVHSIKDGKLHEIYYWCEICSIKMYRLKDCDCCQGPIELREHPVGESFRVTNKPKP